MRIKNLLEVQFDKKYRMYLDRQLIPMLKEWGMEIKAITRETSTQINFMGYFSYSKTYLGLNFSTTSKFMNVDDTGIFCTIVIGGKSVKAGNLTGEDPEVDFEIISSTIEEDFGYNWEDLEGKGMRGEI